MEQDEPQISIAMATYNGAKWLGAQLDSFARQTRLPDELVVTDDGSTDDTATIVARFAAAAPFPVRFVQNAERLGFNGNFAHAVELSGGDIVFISDQDDVWYPDKIERVSALLVEPSCLCVVNDQAIADADGRETGGTVLGNVRALGRPDDWFGPGCCTAFSRDLMPILTPFPGDLVAYDHWINTLSAAIGKRRILDVPLQMYRRHDANASGSVFAARRPGRRHLVRAALATDAGEVLTAKVAEIDTFLTRLTAPAVDRAAGVDADVLATSIAALRAERVDYASRARLLRRRRLARIGPILRLLAKGGYARFSGPVTALKDLVS